MTDDTPPSVVSGSAKKEPSARQLLAQAKWKAYGEWLKSHPEAGTTPDPGATPTRGRTPMVTETLPTPPAPGVSPAGQTVVPSVPSLGTGRFLIFDRKEKGLFGRIDLSTAPGTSQQKHVSFFDGLFGGK